MKIFWQNIEEGQSLTDAVIREGSQLWWNSDEGQRPIKLLWQRNTLNATAGESLGVRQLEYVIIYPIISYARYGFTVDTYQAFLKNIVIKCLDNLELHSFASAEELPNVVKAHVAGLSQRPIAFITAIEAERMTFYGMKIFITALTNEACGADRDRQLANTNEIVALNELGVERSISEIMGKILPGVWNEAMVAIKNRKPAWLKNVAPGQEQYTATQRMIIQHKLNTVCQEARCPNRGECWAQRTATFMIMGEICTRSCRFCSVFHAGQQKPQPLNEQEPAHIAQAVKELGLRHVVITSVDRDDLPDMGASHFARTVELVKENNPDCVIEVLIPDMRGSKKDLGILLKGKVINILGHNVETVPSLYKEVRPGAEWERSLAILRYAKEIQADIVTKSGFMLGLGETKEQILELLTALHGVSCDIVTIGQYLQPTLQQLNVKRYYFPEEYSWLAQKGKELGLGHVEAGPLVRSSYHAATALAAHKQTKNL